MTLHWMLIVGIGCLLPGWGASGFGAAKAAHNRPYVAAIKGGVFYARCVPAETFGSAGHTDIYRVGMEKDERLVRYDWYSREGLVLGWSPIAGAVGVMAKMREPADALDRQVELSFYLDGKRLRSWTATELQELGANIGQEMEMHGSSRGAEFQLLDWVQVENSNEYVFQIEVKGGKKIRFDMLTGEVYKPHNLSRDEARKIAEQVAREKGVRVEDHVLGSSDFDSRKGVWRLFYNHKLPGFPGGHFMVEVNDETRETRFVGGR